jgi:hypothetical protein
MRHLAHFKTVWVWDANTGKERLILSVPKVASRGSSLLHSHQTAKSASEKKKEKNDKKESVQAASEEGVPSDPLEITNRCLHRLAVLKTPVH